MTYDDIVTALMHGKCYQTIDAFDRSIDEETAALMKLGSAQWKGRDMALAAAREFYADEITTQLKTRAPLAPDHVLSYRRLPVVWAVAEVLRTNKLVSDTFLSE